MQLTDPTNKTGLVEDIDFICNTDATSFPLADKVRLINQYRHKAVMRILEVDKNWTYVDPKTGKLAWSYATMTAGQQDYTLPTNLLKLEGVSVKDSTGEFQKLTFITKEQLREDQEEFLSDDGMPKYYMLSGNSVLLYPAPSASDTTLTQGLKLFLSKTIEPLTTSDTTAEPGFAEPFHRICSFGPSYEWLLLNGDQTKAGVAKQELQQLMEEMGIFYGGRNKESKRRIRPAHNTASYI